MADGHEMLRLAEVGSHDYRAFVGPPEKYDLVAGVQFCLVFMLGLRESHTILDVGCGSLRAGKLLIPYLLPDRYFGIEPEGWLIADGVSREIGDDQLRIKRPRFSNDAGFDLTVFGVPFDFILAQSIFTHTSRAQMSQCMRTASAVMKPDSVFIATYRDGELDYEGDSWVYPDVVTYRFETLRSLAEDYGLTLTRIDWPHPNRLDWVVLTRTGGVLPTQLKSETAVVLALRDQLAYERSRLRYIESHPYVRTGRAAASVMRGLRRQLLRIASTRR
jgi:hypothetical protein